MIKLLRRMKSRGFTLIELLVVIAIIAILAAILTPAVNKGLTSGKQVQQLNAAKSILTFMFAKDLEDVVFTTASIYPKKGALDPASSQFPTSTDFFRWATTSGAIKVDFSFYAAPGIPPTKGTNGALFQAANNAWCVSAVGTNYTGLPDTTPVVYTRNLKCVGDKTDGAVSLLDSDPYGKNGAIVGTKGFAVFTLKENTLTNFNPSGVSLDILIP